MNLNQSQKEKIAATAKNHNIKIMTLFGSQVNGKIHQGSDLDVGILLEREPESYQPLLDITSELKEVFSDFEPDVRYLNNVNPYFLFEAVYQGKLIYGSSYDYAKLSARAFKRYADSKSLRDLRDEMIQKKQAELLNS